MIYVEMRIEAEMSPFTKSDGPVDAAALRRYLEDQFAEGVEIEVIDPEDGSVAYVVVKAIMIRGEG